MTRWTIPLNLSLRPLGCSCQVFGDKDEKSNQYSSNTLSPCNFCHNVVGSYITRKMARIGWAMEAHEASSSLTEARSSFCFLDPGSQLDPLMNRQYSPASSLLHPFSLPFYSSFAFCAQLSSFLTLAPSTWQICILSQPHCILLDHQRNLQSLFSSKQEHRFQKTTVSHI